MVLNQNTLWKKVWYLKLPPKIKIFAWRACNDSLPCLKKLYRKKIVRKMNCKFWNQYTEDLSHALLYCFSISYWWKAYLPIINSFEHINQCFLVVTESILKIGNEDEGPKFLTITWNFWGRWNKLVYKDLHIHPQEVIEKALSLDAGYKDYGSMHCNSLMHRNRYFKLNVDGALFFNLQHTGISFILRDSKGNCIMATSVQDIASLNPKTIGTLTILRGLQQCMHMGISCLIIESDC